MFSRKVWKSSTDDIKAHFSLHKEPQGPQIPTEYGTIEGKSYKANGTESDCFLGVPYAKPPVGELRFRKPVPPAPWTFVRKCTRFGPRSIQNDMFWDRVTELNPQSEDCLYLNVFAPKITEGKKYPVMFYIHGGGFVMDSAVRYTPRKMTRLIVSQGIVLVTIQYRLGYLGYYCTGNDASKGNYGLWDQLMALQWTKKNIASFGGDPDRITVAGQSAGAVSTDLLSLSPLSRNLFHQKILLGANSFCHWATTSHNEISDWCLRKAVKCGWKPRREGYQSEVDEHEDMMAFLRTVPAGKFGTHMIGCRPTFEEARLPLAPVVDGEILPASPDELRKTAPSMPSIVGVGAEESLLFIALGFIQCNEKDVRRTAGVIARKTGRPFSEVLDCINKLYDESKGKCHLMKHHATKRKFATLLSDVVSNVACYRYMKHTQSHNKSCYAYSFDYTSRGMWGWLRPLIPYRTGTHASEIIYLFDCNYFSAPLPMNSDDRRLSHRTARWITQFVKEGNPNVEEEQVEWEPLPKTGEPTMFSISQQPKMKSKVFDGRMPNVEAFLSRA